MSYNPATDFLALWRNSGGQASKLEMPGLDYIMAALARAGAITLSVSGTAPVASQSVTAWLKPAVPSSSAEGALFLWDKVTTQYLAATPTLFMQFLEASAGQNGVSWWAVTGAPSNVVGNNGDFAIRTDEPGGVYGPKAGGAWPVVALPGTTDVITSTELDNTFGNAQGTMIYRDTAVWKSLAVGAPNNLIASIGSIPAWETLSALLDAVFGATQGEILYRDTAVWAALAPGTNGQVLSAGGPAANPSWQPRAAEFPSGTVMVFQQTAAPSGWTKQTALDDYGLRVTSGAVGAVGGTGFSTVFAQTTVGNTTLTVNQIPSHSHTTSLDGDSILGSVGGPTLGGSPSTAVFPLGGLVINATGGGAPHTHSVNLQMSYIDVIIASKN